MVGKKKEINMGGELPDVSAKPSEQTRAKKFYWLTLAVLLILSAYPIINGARMAYLGFVNGAIEPWQYAKYVIPYTAMCISVILFAAFQPLICKIRRASFLIGLTGAFAIFVLVERFFESLQIRTAGMMLLDPALLSSGQPGQEIPELTSAAVDIWQASLCAVSPAARVQSAAYTGRYGYFYVMPNDTYKIHYYLISVILKTMVCGLIHGIGKVIRGAGQTVIGADQNNSTGADTQASSMDACVQSNSKEIDNQMIKINAEWHINSIGTGDGRKPLFLQGVAVSLLIALCVFANTTAFFRQPGAIQTPLASVLTCLFFVVAGSAAGVYAGSLLLGQNKRIGLGLPVLLTALTVLGMYIGEAVMLDGVVYRFGIGWFFQRIQGIVLAPVDIAVIVVSSAVTWLVLYFARQYGSWPGKRTVFAAILLCVMIPVGGIIASTPGRPHAEMPVSAEDPALFDVTVTAASTPELSASVPSEGDDLFGCYIFDECIYRNPLSSFIAVKGYMPYVYGLSKDSLIIVNTSTGDMERFSAQYRSCSVDGDEFTSRTSVKLIGPPDVSSYKERKLRAAFTSDSGIKYSLYQMDGEIWLVRLGDEKVGVWSIYRLLPTDEYDIEELEHSFDTPSGAAADMGANH